MTRAYNSKITHGRGSGAGPLHETSILFLPFLVIAGMVILFCTARDERRERKKLGITMSGRRIDKKGHPI